MSLNVSYFLFLLDFLVILPELLQNHVNLISSRFVCNVDKCFGFSVMHQRVWSGGFGDGKYDWLDLRYAFFWKGFHVLEVPVSGATWVFVGFGYVALFDDFAKWYALNVLVSFDFSDTKIGVVISFGLNFEWAAVASEFGLSYFGLVIFFHMTLISFSPFSDPIRDLPFLLLKFHVLDDSLSNLASVKVFEQLIVFLNLL